MVNFKFNLTFLVLNDSNYGIEIQITKIAKNRPLQRHFDVKFRFSEMKLGCIQIHRQF